jgi:hypothetical protein
MISKGFKLALVSTATAMLLLISFSNVPLENILERTFCALTGVVACAVSIWIYSKE